MLRNETNVWTLYSNVSYRSFSARVKSMRAREVVELLQIGGAGYLTGLFFPPGLHAAIRGATGSSNLI